MYHELWPSSLAWLLVQFSLLTALGFNGPTYEISIIKEPKYKRNQITIV